MGISNRIEASRRPAATEDSLRLLSDTTPAFIHKEAVRDQFARPFITAFLGNRHLVKLGGTLWGPH